jgi:hypothetical protein
MSATLPSMPEPMTREVEPAMPSEPLVGGIRVVRLLVIAAVAIGIQFVPRPDGGGWREAIRQAGSALAESAPATPR